MKIIIENKQFELDNCNFDTILFETNSVREIVIVKIMQNTEKFYLEELYNFLRTFKDIKEITFEFSKEQSITVKSGIKNIWYRSPSVYKMGDEIVLRETIIIRLYPDCFPKVNLEKQIVTCDLQCPYFKPGFCTRFKTKLNIIKDTLDSFVCTQCFMENKCLHEETDEMILYNKILDNLEKNKEFL